jgi:hypothetical protein
VVLILEFSVTIGLFAKLVSAAVAWTYLNGLTYLNIAAVAISTVERTSQRVAGLDVVAMAKVAF